MRQSFPEDAPVEFRVDAILMGVGGPTDGPTVCDSVGRQIGEARPKAGIDVPIQDFRGWVDVRISVVHVQTGSHGLLLLSA
jgi:hypothetical protein